MAQTIQVKRSTATAAPIALANGELAYSHVGTVGKLYIGRPGGTAGDIDVIGGKYFTDLTVKHEGWGDHSTEGYLVATPASYNNTQWDTAYTYSQVGHLPLAGGTLTGNLALYNAVNPTVTVRNTDTTIVANQPIGTFEFRGDDDNGNVLAGNIQQVASADWGIGSYNSEMVFSIKTGGTGGLFEEKLKLRYGGVDVSASSNPTVTIKSTDTTVFANDVIGTLEFRGTDDQTGGVLAGHIQQKAAQGADWGTGNYGSNMSFSIKEAGNGAPFVEKLRLQTSGAVLTGDLAVSGTVDGRDVATDGTKLDTVATNANNYTLANLNTHLAGGVGNIVTSGYIRGPAAMVIDPAAHADATGSLTILGDLIVEGTTTTVNSTVVEIADETIVLNKNQTGTPLATLSSGISIERGDLTNAGLLWREDNDAWYVAEGGGVTHKLLHASNWSTAYTGVVDGGSF